MSRISEVREAALRPAAGPPLAQDALPQTQRNERATSKPKRKMVSPEVKVQAVRTQLSALELMKGRATVPKHIDPTVLPGGGKLGRFWTNCKIRKACENVPCDRLLSNPLLKIDYRTGVNYSWRHEKPKPSLRVRVDFVMELMKGRARVPKKGDPTMLPGGGKLGLFWHCCKGRGRCEHSPYNRLLDNPLLKLDYRT